MTGDEMSSVIQHRNLDSPLARDLLRERITRVGVPDDAGGCHVETFYDATQDSFGSGKIEQYTCDGARLAELCGGVSTEGCQ